MTQTATPPVQVMPAAFFGHGNPMNALEVNRYTAAWRAFGQAVPRPRAILVISAHWYINATAVTAMPRPRTIHDFYGFPRSCSTSSTRLRGCPSSPTRSAMWFKPTWVGADVDTWGIDHGTWSVLVHAFPDASIPVVQLSINANKPLRLPPRSRREAGAAARAGRADHRQRQRRAQPARDELEARRQRLRLGARFDEEAKERMLTDPTEIARLDAHPTTRTPSPPRTTSSRSSTWPDWQAPPQGDRHRRARRRIRLRVAVDDRLHPRSGRPGRPHRRRLPATTGHNPTGRVQHLASRPFARPTALRRSGSRATSWSTRRRRRGRLLAEPCGMPELGHGVRSAGSGCGFIVVDQAAEDRSGSRRWRRSPCTR